MFSCEIWEIFKSTYFEKHLRTTASIWLRGKAARWLNKIYFWEIKQYQQKQKQQYIKHVRILSFAVCIFLHSDWLRWSTKWIPALSPNAGEYNRKNSEHGHVSHSAKNKNKLNYLQSILWTRNIYRQKYLPFNQFYRLMKKF